MGKKDLESKDVLDIYDLVWSQCKEDREVVLDLFHDLKSYINNSPETRYPINGDTLAKCAELLTKQTSQVLELLKVANKDKQKDSSLSADDLSFVQEEINKK